MHYNRKLLPCSVTINERKQTGQWEEQRENCSIILKYSLNYEGIIWKTREQYAE
jgi:hypothetical protein